MIVWLSSYPRSGNTFLRTLLKTCFDQDTYSIYNDDDIGGDAGLADITGHKPLKHSVGSPDFDLSEFRQDDQPVFVKTHEPTRALVEDRDKVIYIARDGREASLSFQRYLRNFHERDATWLNLQLGLEFPGKSWGQHVDQWAPLDHDDTLFLSFEKMIDDPAKTLTLISGFVGLPVINEMPLTFEDLQNTNSKFFSKGKTKSFEVSLDDQENALFLLSAYRELALLGYDPSMPELLESAPPELLERFSTLARIGTDRFQSEIADQKEMLTSRSADLTKQKREIDTQQDRIEKQRAEIKRLSQVNTALDAKAAELVQSVKRRDQKIATLQNKTETLENSLRKRVQLIATLEDEKARNTLTMTTLRKDLMTSNNHIAAMEQTLSWKITYPLRAIRNLFSRRAPTDN